MFGWIAGRPDHPLADPKAARLTFAWDAKGPAAIDVDYEDYH